MSTIYTEIVAQFFHAVSQQEDLQQQLIATRNPEEVVKVAQDYDFKFTVADWQQVIQGHQSSHSASDTLKNEIIELDVTEEQLDAWWKFAWETGDIHLIGWVYDKRDAITWLQLLDEFKVIKKEGQSKSSAKVNQCDGEIVQINVMDSR
ncbi:Nif11-like leader peptide family natural product precursor [Moorena producens JHB]|uniref:Nif11-like leader peptide family natural product n=1 Tax=Moorena producens (strain JHB) TaxID=1454205 RepID=A0A1D9G972_MOOP1|nr:Nif11-like leader peptide family natural product precursor [Moorena producens]AOY84216.1 Nif11-like leader peptide family natural product precursor [Moorena producens JHB]